MNKVELIDAVSKKLDCTKKAASEAIDAVFGVISDTVAEGNDVKISGFGTFGITERAAREGRNPATGDKITIAASKSPKFKSAKAFKDAVNK